MHYYVIIACGGNLDAKNDVQYIKSKNYPATYKQSQDCQFGINASFGYYIAIKFEELKVDANCTYAYVELFEQISSKQTLIAKLCSTHGVNKTYQSSGSRMIVKFNLEGRNTSKRFKASFKQGWL